MGFNAIFQSIKRFVKLICIPNKNGIKPTHLETHDPVLRQSEKGVNIRPTEEHNICYNKIDT